MVSWFNERHTQTNPVYEGPSQPDTPSLPGSQSEHPSQPPITIAAATPRPKPPHSPAGNANGPYWICCLSAVSGASGSQCVEPNLVVQRVPPTRGGRLPRPWEVHERSSGHWPTRRAVRAACPSVITRRHEAISKAGRNSVYCCRGGTGIRAFLLRWDWCQPPQMELTPSLIAAFVMVKEVFEKRRLSFLGDTFFGTPYLWLQP